MWSLTINPSRSVTPSDPLVKAGGSGRLMVAPQALPEWLQGRGQQLDGECQGMAQDHAGQWRFALDPNLATEGPVVIADGVNLS